jgi:hypothetical protein
MKIRTWTFVGILALLVAFVSCDRDDDDDDIPGNEIGRFEATVTGDITTEFNGVAVYALYQHIETDELFFTVGFGGNNGDYAINVWFVRGGDYPGNDTYGVVSFDQEEMEDDLWFFDVDEFVGLSIVQDQEATQEIEVYFSESGTISFEMTGQNILTGEFDITVTGYVMDLPTKQDEELQISISGTFNAVPGEVQFPNLNGLQ